MSFVNSSSDLHHPFSLSFLLPSWLAMRSYWPHLQVRDPIWHHDWSYSVRQTVSLLRFSGFFLCREVNTGWSMHSPRYHLISLKLFGLSPCMTPWTTGLPECYLVKFIVYAAIEGPMSLWEKMMGNVFLKNRNKILLISKFYKIFTSSRHMGLGELGNAIKVHYRALATVSFQSHQQKCEVM